MHISMDRKNKLLILSFDKEVQMERIQEYLLEYKDKLSVASLEEKEDV